MLTCLIAENGEKNYQHILRASIPVFHRTQNVEYGDKICNHIPQNKPLFALILLKFHFVGALEYNVELKNFEI